MFVASRVWLKLVPTVLLFGVCKVKIELSNFDLDILKLLFIFWFEWELLSYIGIWFVVVGGFDLNRTENNGVTRII